MDTSYWAKEMWQEEGKGGKEIKVQNCSIA